MKKLRVAAYCRVSTDQSDQLHSLAAQKRFFTDYIAARPDWIFAGIWADEGVSGTSTSRRTQFCALMTAAENGALDLILTKEVSRFARNTVDTLNCTRQLSAWGVGVLFLNDNIDTRAGEGEFRLTIMASVAQEESRRTSERVKWGQRRSMERGVVFGADTLYGYRLHGGVLTVCAEQAEVVRQVYQLFLEEGRG
ncbi:MAG: recombinase family protein, partial [Agathobaculum sp.]|uniref:recombinase family protein n=1 Tax=Agathobaculum sp. TaxID=2048138 RepID=UPI003D9025FA